MIEADSLVKDYVLKTSLRKREKKIVHAVKDISFTIREGERVGFIGLNGAGKTTTLKMLAGILKPDSGNVRVNGVNPYNAQNDFFKDLGFIMGNKSVLFYDIPVKYSFLFYKDVYGLSDAEYARRLEFYFENLGIDDLYEIPVRKLSLGQRMLCEIAVSLLHNPKVLFLDEPTIGLDIVVKKRIFDFLRSLNSRNGSTIILTTHQIEDIDTFCSRVIIIDEGKICFDGNIKDIFNRGSSKIIEVSHSDAFDLSLHCCAKDATVLRQEENAIEFLLQKEQINGVIKSLLDDRSVLDVNIKERTLESILQGFYGNRDA